MAKDSEYGGTWYSPDGPISIKKNGSFKWLKDDILEIKKNDPDLISNILKGKEDE